MKCIDCKKEATHFVNDHIPHCQECMLDALCSVATPVINIESWEVAQREQAKDYPRAS